MRNEELEHCILENLNRVDCGPRTGLKERALRAAVWIEIDRSDITTADFEKCLASLEDKALIESFTNLLGDLVWGITDAGKAALKGI